MKIAITSNGTTLDDPVEARFGRCPYFIFVNPDTLEFESIPNPNMSLGGGAVVAAWVVAEVFPVFNSESFYCRV